MTEIYFYQTCFSSFTASGQTQTTRYYGGVLPVTSFGETFNGLFCFTFNPVITCTLITMTTINIQKSQRSHLLLPTTMGLLVFLPTLPLAVD